MKKKKKERGTAAVAGLSPYWHDPHSKPSIEWEKWSDLFSVAMTAKHSRSTAEVLRRMTNETDRYKALLNNLDHAVAGCKCVSVLYLSLGVVARKTFMVKFPNAKIAEISLEELLKNCKDTFDTKRNSALDRFRFLSRKQMQTESLEQFWHSLKGLAAECDFGTQTESLVHDIFMENMKNQTVQEKLRTGPKATPQEALAFAIAFAEGTIRQKSYGDTKTKIKVELVCIIKQKERLPTMWHGEGKTCKAKGKQCNKCRKNPSHTNKRTTTATSTPRRTNWVEAEEEQENTDEQEEEQYVLGIDGGGSPPFMTKGKLNRKKFCLMIDSGSPVTIIGLDELQKILQLDELFLRKTTTKRRKIRRLQQTTGRPTGIHHL